MARGRVEKIFTPFELGKFAKKVYTTHTKRLVLAVLFLIVSKLLSSSNGNYMSGGNKKLARQCALCKRVGHNRSTCPERGLRAPKAAPAATSHPPEVAAGPLKFFVHHTQSNATPSAHQVNLRDRSPSPWLSVGSASPTAPKNPSYYFHHTDPDFSIDTDKKTGAEVLAADDGPLVEPRDTTPVNIIFENFSFWEKLRRVPDFFFFAIKKIRWPVRLPKKVTPRPELVLPSPTPQSPAQKPSIRYQRIAYPLAGTTLVLFLVIGVLALYQYGLGLLAFVHTNEDTAIASVDALVAEARAVQNHDWLAAQAENKKALTKIQETLTSLANNHQILQTVAGALPVVGTRVTDAKRLALAVYQVTLANDALFNSLNSLPATSTIGAKIVSLSRGSDTALPLYTKAAEAVAKTSPGSVPASVRDRFVAVQALVASATDDLSMLRNLVSTLPDLFGGNGRRRYLVFFQNPAELRASGGFLGSYAFVEMHDGELTTLSIPPGGTYDVQGQLSQYVEPPAPLLMTNRRWELQDANWFPDWPTDAKKIDWFYRHSRGVSVDGVIAVNATVLPQVLALLGPVTDTERQTVFDAGSALGTLQTLVETGKEKAAGKPKAVIGDLATSLGERAKNISSPAELVGLAAIVGNALANKDIQIALFDKQQAAILKKLGWDGSLSPVSSQSDYLLVAATNIGGQKSDARVTEHVDHQAVVNADGTVDVTLTIRRTHNGTSTEPLYGATNVSYVRVYVPNGSTLISASGWSWPDERSFRAPLSNATADQDLLAAETPNGLDAASGTGMFTSLDKTMFANWMITEPGHTSAAVFRYRLPFRLPIAVGSNPERWLSHLFGNVPTIPYQLQVDKQSGANNTFSTSIIFPDTFVTRWVGGPNAIPAKNGVSAPPAPLTSNTIFSLLMQQL